MQKPDTFLKTVPNRMITLPSSIAEPNIPLVAAARYSINRKALQLMLVQLGLYVLLGCCLCFV